MAGLPFTSVIIPTYNRAALLPLTLDSFLSQDYPKDRYEILVVDNNSSDGTREVLQRYLAAQSPEVTYVFEPRQGVHYARNTGGRIARGDILYFTDDDMVAEKNLLTELVKVFDLDPLIGSATGKIIGRFEIEPPGWVRRCLINAKLSLTEESKPEDLIVSRDDLCYSCHQAVKREALFRCGGFNPENTAGVWIGDGETGLGIKLKAAGYKFAYTSRSVIHHLIPPSRTTLVYLIKRLGNQGYCDSYTAYRTHRKRARIPLEMLERNTLGLAKWMLATIAFIALRRESWHFLLARIYYLHKRNLYDLKLYRDAAFRKLVEIDDWINSDVTVSRHGPR